MKDPPKMTTMSFFGDKLRAARKKAGLTQDQIAAELGMLRTNYNPYETGKKHPAPEVLESISKIVGVEISVLKAWMRLDEVPLDERKAMIAELMQSLPNQIEERDFYKQLIKQLFSSLSPQDRLELLGPAAEYFKNEMIKQEQADNE